MFVEKQKTKTLSPAETLYYATTKDDLSPGYTALENHGLRGWLARRLMEVERQTIRTKSAVETAGEKLETWKHQRLNRAVEQLQEMFVKNPYGLGAEYREFKYGFRVRIRPYKKVIRYERRRRGAEWKSGDNNVAIVLAYTDEILKEIASGRSGKVSSRTAVK